MRTKYGTYLQIFHEYLAKSLAATSSSENVDFTLEGFNVVERDDLTLEDLKSFDGVLITGSGETWRFRYLRHTC